jgi:hypothetical protein
MANYSKTVSLTSAGATSTQNVSTGDTISVTCTISHAGSNVQTIATNCSVSPTSDSTSPYNFTVSSFTSSSYSIEFYYFDSNTNEYSHTLSGTVTSSPSYTAPTISSVTNNNVAAANVTATVTLSSNGSGGTLQYAQTTSNSVPASGWQSSNQFSHPRGTTRYYWASQATNTSGAYSSSVYHAVSFISPDTSVSATSSTITVSSTSAGTTLSNATSGETYAVRINNGSTNLGTRSGNGVITWTSSLPSAGATTTYEIFALRPTSIGGSGTYVGTNDTFTVARDSGASTTYSVSAPASINEGSAGTVTVSTTGFGSGTLYWSVSPSGDFSTSTGSVSISNNSGSFSVTPTADSTTEGAESASVALFTNSARTNQVASDSFTINDTSTTPAGSSTFGVQVFNASGTKLLDVTDTLERFVQSGTVTVAMNNGTTDVTVSGMTNTDSWTVLIVPQNTNNLGSLYSVRTAKGTNKFTVTNSTSGSGSTTYDYWVLTT